MKYIHFILLSSLLVLASINGYSANDADKKGNIIGLIIDQASNSGIEYANIVLFNLEDSTIFSGTISAVDGKFELKDIPKGNYYLSVNFIGYEKYEISKIGVTSNRTQINVGKITLKPSQIELEGAEVIADKNYVDFRIDKKVVNVSQHLNAEGGSAVDVLHNVPSVQVDAEGNVSLRGSTNFTVLIDGRPSVMGASDVLKQIPASAIDNIEIITNPSVKYDPDGISGIINLIMKKQKTLGINGQINTTIATGNKYRANFMLNLRKNKWNTYIGTSYSDQPQQTENGSIRESFRNDSTFFETLDAVRDIRRKSLEFNLGADYFLNKNNTISLQSKIGNWSFNRLINSELENYSEPISTHTYYKMLEDFTTQNNYINADLNFQHKFKKEGHQFDINAFYTKLYNESPDVLDESETDFNFNPIIATNYKQQILNNSDRDHIRLKADYVLPVSEKLKIEAGYQSDINNSKTDYTFQTLPLIMSSWQTDPNLSGDMDYKRLINSVYGIVGTSLKGFSIQGGLRSEFVNRSIYVTSTDDLNEYNKINLFPSVHISKKLKNNNQIQMSYSRRIDRPTEWQLSPLANASDRFLIRKGNAALLPEYTNSYEISYSYRNKQVMFNTDIYYRNTSNAITNPIVQDGTDFIETYENLDKMVTTGMELMGNWNATSWLKLNTSANLYYYDISGTLNSGLNIDNSSYTWNGRFNSTFIVKKETTFQFLAIYYAPNILPQGEISNFYYFDFILKRSFLEKKLTVSVRTHNTFDTGKFIFTSNGENFNSESWHKYEGPVFILSLSYKINNYKPKRLKNNVEMNFDSGMDM